MNELKSMNDIKYVVINIVITVEINILNILLVIWFYKIYLVYTLFG